MSLTLLSPEERERLEEFETRKAAGLPIIDCAERVFLQTLGHELAHCFVENVPGH